MEDVSDFGVPVQQPGPEILPFDAAGVPAGGGDGDDGDGDDDDGLEDTVLAAPDSGDFDPEPDPAGASAAVVVSAPRGPLPVVPGYTVSAVVTSLDADDAENYPQFAILGRKTESLQHAKGLAFAAALSPARLAGYRLPFVPDLILVTDHAGRTVKRLEVRKAA